MRRVVLGRIAGLYGLQGWVRVHSDTDPRDGIFAYAPWLLGPAATPTRVLSGRIHGKGLVAHLEGCDDRDRAAALLGQDIAIGRDQLPPPQPDEFYWCDLEGLQVSTREGLALGRVERLFSTGVNDVLVVRGEREHLLPFAWGTVVLDVDFAAGQVAVDWDPEF